MCSSDLHWTQAKKLTADNPKQQERLDALFSNYEQWIGKALEPEIALRRKVNDGQAKMDELVASVRAAKGKQYMDGMRAQLSQIGEAESVLLTQRTKEAEQLQARTSAVLIFGSLAAILMAAGVGYLLVRDLLKVLGGEPAYAAEVMERVSVGDFKIGRAHV